MDIQETTFEAKRYLTLKKTIPTTQVTDKQMYEDAGQVLGEYIGQNNLEITGPWSVLYFTWDEKNKTTDIGIAFPIEKNEEMEALTNPDLSIVDIPDLKAAMTVLEGSYEKLGQTHASLMQYVKEKAYDTSNVPLLGIEEYAIGPMQDPNPESWITNIYYFYN